MPETLLDGAKTLVEALHIQPTPLQVATLARSHGLPACRERWGYVPSLTLKRLHAQGKALLQEPA